MLSISVHAFMTSRIDYCNALLFMKTAALLFSITASLIHAMSETMYERELPSGRRILCDRCPPGSHMRKHCTETQPTECRRCNEGFYTEHWNYIYDCLPCDWCSQDQVVTQECTSSTNRVCACKEGFYSYSGVCRPHTVCPHGFGVKEKGTPHKDTVCEVCKNGYHAAGEPGNTRCVQNTVCKSEEKFQIHGSNCLDNVCVTCKSIIHQGWVNLTYQCFLEIFKRHNNLKLQQFVNGLDIFDNEQELHSIPDKDACIHHLHRWFSRASEEQVHKLPDQLQKAGMKNLSQKIRNRINYIQIKVNLCNNKVSNHI
ncbi:tumor necrosis factor receptor superfamily member 21 precursor [Silurus asotus]|uniref:Tumor necrosis factor receptor superfamily member 21 n=1 Tax=Silurus asotus TaxID=30991 RepID=A0AAD5AXX7_SILAS|nr:tumor necrosis factor receptor superfamily member 21 precursor [Silurus asotus]